MFVFNAKIRKRLKKTKPSTEHLAENNTERKQKTPPSGAVSHSQIFINSWLSKTPQTTIDPRNQTVIHLHSSALAAEVPYSFPQDLFTEQTEITYTASLNGQTCSASSLDGISEGLFTVGGGQADTEVVCSVTITGQFAESNGLAKVTYPGLEKQSIIGYADLSGGTWSVSGTAMTLEALAANDGFKTQDAWDFAMVMEFEVGDNVELDLNTSGSSTDVHVDWRDGTEVTHHTGTRQPSHTYTSAGTYDVRMIGTVPAFYLLDSSFRSSLRKVKSWGRLDGLSSLVGAFSGCAGLLEIVSDTLGAFENVDTFYYCFQSCSGLTAIPDGLFDNCTDLTHFSGCFYGCSSLTAIPEGLFNNCPKVTDFSFCFYGCSSLTAIPDGLFDNCPDVTNFSYCFEGCSSLKSIPDGLFDNCTGVTTFRYCFQGCSSLTAIPDGLFDNCPNVTNFSYCFHDCSGLTSIPDGLFANCPDVTDFGYCFRECSSLTSIPQDLFDNGQNVQSFDWCFYNCRNLTSIPTDLFANCPNVTSFSSCFATCVSLSGTTPKDTDGGELWERAGKEGYPASVSGVDCFRECTGLSNYDEIPEDWK